MFHFQSKIAYTFGLVGFCLLFKIEVRFVLDLHRQWWHFLSIFSFFSSIFSKFFYFLPKKILFFLFSSIFSIFPNFQFSIFSVFSNFEKIRYCPRFVCPSVCRATTFQGVDRSCSFMAQSIAYDPRAWTKEGFFFKPILAPTGGVRSPNSIHFHIKIRFYWYLRRIMSLMLDRVGSGSNVPPT